MNNAIKASLIVIYVLALIGLVVPFGAADILLKITLVLLVIHAIEAVVMFKHVRRYEGPLAVSILLTLLFGLLHWKPLAAKAAREGQA
jgi:uncharacterized protein YhhL (DUF1145 family)